jgi:hypothetical protein
MHSVNFDYLIEKIADAPLLESPFRHIEINSFFRDEDFEALLADPQIGLPTASSDEDLLDVLTEHGFAPVSFPGTTSDPVAYLEYKRGLRNHSNDSTCERMGMTYRLEQPTSPLLRTLEEFFSSDAFLSVAAAKFSVPLGKTRFDGGLQKYLDGYEISPHPDTRRKALTYMINVNTAPDSERLGFHTQYSRLSAEWRYVEDFWKNNPDSDRSWVPWSWCETVKQQSKNNSMVMFSPSDDTMHAVRASYEHLQHQRTQFYGNLWYRGPMTSNKPDWQDLARLNDVPGNPGAGHGQPEANAWERALGKLRRAIRALRS